MTAARAMPDFLEGYGPLGAPGRIGKTARRGEAKLLPDLDAAVRAAGLSDGATVSFHHHLRNGDGVLNAVLDALARAGLGDLHVAASSIFPVHAPLVGHMRSGVVGALSANFVAGPVAEAISEGVLARPAVLRTHGGRARAIAEGALAIDAAFVAAPAADVMGNLSGTEGPCACGVLGYPQCDVRAARRVIAVTDTLVPYPAARIEIPQDRVDFVARIPSLGDAGGILSGTTRPSAAPEDLAIAEAAAEVIAASGLLVDGLSLQNGAGGASLAAAAAIGRRMGAASIRGSFASGGITGVHVEMLEAGLFARLLDVQCFDPAAIRSFRDDPRHQGMSAAMYAAPSARGAVVDRLDAVVLGAAEIDIDFNVNVTTRADGRILGGSGGHADTAAGARLAVVTTKLTAAGFPKIVERVGTLTTPGATVDAVVTEAGIAVNPAREDLADRLAHAGLAPVPIADLARRAAARAERRPRRPSDTPVVAVSEYRDGTVTDLVRRV